MGTSTTTGIMQLAEQALAEVEAITSEEELARKADGDLVFVDVRDIREVEQSATIEGSYHVWTENGDGPRFRPFLNV